MGSILLHSTMRKPSVLLAILLLSLMETEAQSTLNAGGATGKGRWPDVVGMPVEEAKTAIERDMSGAMFHVVSGSGYVSMDFVPERIRLFVDASRKVTRAPMLG